MKLKYKGKRIIIRGCNYKSFRYHVANEFGTTFIYINKNISKVERRYILHKILKSI